MSPARAAKAAAARPEVAAVKETLRSAERLRAIGVALYHANRWQETGRDSWAREGIDENARLPER